MLTDKFEWVAVMTNPQAERKAAKALGDLGLEVYLPMLCGHDRRHKGADGMEKPMFPGYLFVKINNRLIYDTRTARGVFGIVTSDHSACVVPQCDIDNVRAFEATQRKVFVHDTSALVKGAMATITAGEFAGMQGRLIRGCKDGNFAVCIEVMHLSLVVHVRRDELRPADPASQPDRIRAK